jgi:hypothetical protein
MTTDKSTIATDSGKKISTGYARQLAKNFKERKKIGNDPQGVWFSRESILSLLEDRSVSGIRFYFGAYGTENEHSDAPLKDKKHEKTTLIMVQTAKTNQDDSEEVIHRDILENPNDEPHYPDQKEFTFIELNDGQLCPPPPLGKGDKNDLLFGINP